MPASAGRRSSQGESGASIPSEHVRLPMSELPLAQLQRSRSRRGRWRSVSADPSPPVRCSHASTPAIASRMPAPPTPAKGRVGSAGAVRSIRSAPENGHHRRPHRNQSDAQRLVRRPQQQTRSHPSQRRRSFSAPASWLPSMKSSINLTSGAVVAASASWLRASASPTRTWMVR